MVILFFQYLQEQHQQQQQEEQQQCHKEVKYTVTQFPQFKKNICSARQPSVCSKNKGVGGGALWTPPLNQPLKRIKKKAEKPQKNGKEFERPLESIGLKNWLSKESKSFKNRENIK